MRRTRHVVRSMKAFCYISRKRQGAERSSEPSSAQRIPKRIPLVALLNLRPSLWLLDSSCIVLPHHTWLLKFLPPVDSVHRV